MRDRRRQPDMPYTELYFKFKVLREVGRGLAVAIAIVLGAIYFVAASIWPNQAPGVAAAVVWFSMMAGVFAIFIAITSALSRQKPTANDLFVKIGMMPNPDPPWLDEQGRRIYRRVGDSWVRCHLNSEPDSFKLPSPVL